MSQALCIAMPVSQRHQAMVAILQQYQLDAIYISAEDEHLNEYLAHHKKRIEWLTNFTGENAPAIVTRETVHLFADGRFHIQVDDEVDSTVVTAHKLGLPDVLAPDAFLHHLAQQKTTPLKVGYNPFTITAAGFKRLSHKTEGQVEWVALSTDPVDDCWQEKPAASEKSIFKLEAALAGQSVSSKLSSIRKVMADQQADYLLLTRLDEVAWLLNCRGQDVPYNPVFESYVLLSQSQAHVFVRQDIVPEALKTDWQTQGISLCAYSDFANTVQALGKQTKHAKAWLDATGSTLGSKALFEPWAQLIETPNPVLRQKALKNAAETKAMQNANLQASIAISEHLSWAHQQFESGKTLDEVQLRNHLEKEYAKRPGFFELSFPTIPGLGSNSAIIHYCNANPEAKSENGCWYLVDSGAHYDGGTTDTTRTTVLGQPTSEQKRHYTLVLKCHIDCANQVFPKGTTGAQLDAICRSPLWQAGLNFGHGTGHGVGAFLNVHEGPNRISSVCSVAFEPGMVTSIEPGYYKAGWGGIRLENLYVVTDAGTKENNTPWYQFETLTLLPFEAKLIDAHLLTQDEKDWLKQFSELILEKTYPHCSPLAQAWLTQQCQHWL